MICPFCHHADNYVLETRLNRQGQLRRRRQCEGCQGKFSTIEKVIIAKLLVNKRDGRRELFDRKKVKRGLVLALKKRNIDDDLIERMARRVEDEVIGRGLTVVESSEIGRMVMVELKKIDEVAYLRFTSVCQDFVNLEQFEQEMKNLKNV